MISRTPTAQTFPFRATEQAALSREDLFQELEHASNRIRDLEVEQETNRRAQADFEKHQSRYKGYLANSVDGLWCFEAVKPMPIYLSVEQQIDCMLRDTRMVECNDTMARMYGYPNADAIRGVPISHFWDRNDPLTIQFFTGLILSGYKLLDVESTEIGADNLPRYFINNVVCEIEDGMLVRGWGTQKDITSQKKLEEQLRHSQKMEAVGRLAGGIAHDFNNLLTVINGYTDFLLTQPADLANSTKMLEAIHSAGERAAKLTQQLLNFSRKQPMKQEVLCLNKQVHQIRSLMSNLLGEEVSLAMRLTPDNPSILADSSQLDQVLMNLVVNAKDAMHDGGNLSIATDVVTLDGSEQLMVNQVKPGRYVRLAVTDTGSGIPQEIRSCIFEPFFTTKEKGKGTGLGLATVYSIVQQTKGLLDFVTETGKGTTFQVYWPVLETSGTEDTAPPKAIETKQPKKVKLLLVEDDDIVADFAERILQGHHYEVIVASCAEEAMARMRENQDVALLVTDVILPGTNGRELASKLLEAYPNLKVLCVSGHMDSAFSAEEAKTFHFLQKPYSVAVFQNKVKEILNSQVPSA